MKRILIIGAGKIAEEYLKVIKVNKNIVTSCIFSRTYTKALSLSKKFKIKNTFKNKEDIVKNMNIFDAIIVAVNIENNLDVLKFCLRLKKKILIEKPLALNFKKNKSISKLNNNLKKLIFVAMNRRFFDSTIYLKKRLMKYSNKKKRVLEVYDCQNERFFEKRKFHQDVRKNLMYANSIHLIDYFNIFCRGTISRINVVKEKFKNVNFLFAILKFSSGDIGYYTCDLNYLTNWKVRLGLDHETWTFSPLETVLYKNIKNNNNKFTEFKTIYKDGFYNQINEFEKLLNGKKNNLVSFKTYFKTIIMIKKIYGK